MQLNSQVQELQQQLAERSAAFDDERRAWGNEKEEMCTAERARQNAEEAHGLLAEELRAVRGEQERDREALVRAEGERERLAASLAVAEKEWETAKEERDRERREKEEQAASLLVADQERRRKQIAYETVSRMQGLAEELAAELRDTDHRLQEVQVRQLTRVQDLESMAIRLLESARQRPQTFECETQTGESREFGDELAGEQLGRVEIRLTLDIDVRRVGEDCSSERAAFDKQLVLDVSTAAAIPLANISLLPWVSDVLSMHPIIPIVIHADPPVDCNKETGRRRRSQGEGVRVNPASVAANLVKQASGFYSPLRAGVWTRYCAGIVCVTRTMLSLEKRLAEAERLCGEMQSVQQENEKLAHEAALLESSLQQVCMPVLAGGWVSVSRSACWECAHLLLCWT